MATQLADTNYLQPNILSLLDFCKGIAILAIFLLHYSGGWFGWEGVHIFIVLSGFGLTYSCLNRAKPILWKQWYLKRANKLLPAYWLVVLAGFFIMLFLWSFETIKGLSVSVSLQTLIAQLFEDLSLLKVFSNQYIETIPNPQFWFIPFIFSFYICFPYLYRWLTQQTTTKQYIVMFLGTVSIEFLYRFVAIYRLDGIPIAMDEGFGIFPVPNFQLDIIPVSFPFQGEAPFGLFLSRIGEFVLGMLGATALIQQQQLFHKLFLNRWIMISGILIWLAGNLLIYVGLWGWIFDDFIIALGLSLCMLGIAQSCKKACPYLFLKVSQLGVWSYYIYLTHFIFIYLFSRLGHRLTLNADSIHFWIIKLIILGLIVLGTGIASWLIMKFEKARSLT